MTTIDASGPLPRRALRALAALGALAVVFGISLAAVRLTNHAPGDASSPVAAPISRAVATPVTVLTGLAAPTGDPELPSLSGLHPRRGDAVRAAGPFDDRLTLTGLRFDGKALHASARVTSDVSDVLEFASRAGFYDASGRLVATATYTYHLDEDHPDAHAHGADGTPDEVRTFSITVPAEARGTAVSAAVGVTVLVNE
ncbi:hypothetical protein [Intrasporangium sp. YIM S08009]|uniref:hypothetical protein n=1 Tax=Intrasporangium zincisolvens TaxID=3080018 RepID=UPI002B05336B|nr:hypothetical protein [Intrasporangium sp. YIM S08009]